MGEPPGLPRLGRRGEGWVFIQLALFAVVAITGIVGARWADGWRVPMIAAGVALGGPGVMLVTSGLRSLGSSLTPLPVPHERSELKSSGAYALVRHPIYGGLILVALAWALLLSPWALLPAGILALFFSLKARFEEAFLVRRYQDAYRAYAERVRHRFVPYLW
jgi:protein-S-isoprenylcysteine O-methyltransferase Ste14